MKHLIIKHDQGESNFSKDAFLTSSLAWNIMQDAQHKVSTSCREWKCHGTMNHSKWARTSVKALWETNIYAWWYMSNIAMSISIVSGQEHILRITQDCLSILNQKDMDHMVNLLCKHRKFSLCDISKFYVNVPAWKQLNIKQSNRDKHCTKYKSSNILQLVPE